VTAQNGDRLAKLEEQMAVTAWLLAEARHQNLLLATSVAALLAQRMQPQIQAHILEQLRGGS